MKNPYRMSEDMRFCYVQFRNGAEFLIDAGDFPFVSQYSWWLSNKGYPATTAKGKKVTLHKLLIPDAQGMDIDHISGDPLDNRRANLRVCTHQQNMFNQRRRSNNTSGYTGVSYLKNTRSFEAYIMCHGIKRRVGLFHNAPEAARARDLAALQTFGEYARLNFPKQCGAAYG